MKQELYHWLYQMDLYREHFSSEEALKSAMLNTVKFYELVHENDARLVGPINLHVLLIDPEYGHFEVKAGGNRDSLIQDVDSVKFMPPEILNKSARWNLDADKFVLAELLFVLRYCKHPYDGRQVLKQPITDIDKARELYSNCRFIFDPDDSMNGLDYNTDPEPMERWNHDENAQLKSAFLQVFTQGFSNSSLRLNDNAWEHLIEGIEV